MKVKLEFVHCYHNCDPFKQKEATMLIDAIQRSRLADDMWFRGYGNIVFDESDESHRYPVIAYTDDNGEYMGWSRKNANCLVYELPKTGNNNNGKKDPLYDRLFLYHTNSRSGQGQWYGYIAYNTETREQYHKFFIDHEGTDILTGLNRFFYSIPIMNRNRRLLEKARREFDKEYYGLKSKKAKNRETI